MEKEIIVSGIQPTGELHLGNYLGAVRNWLNLQEEYRGRMFVFIADYHSMTNEEVFSKYSENGLEMAVELLALGIDPKKVVLFFQKDVPEVTELCWIFNTLIPVTFLERMTQYKDKSSRASTVNMGLMDYPVLQVADILLYGGNRVPVGEDQVQHVELTRDAARFFNKRFGDFFVEPKPLLTKSARVMALNFPDKKMSKSIPGSAINLNDSPEEIKSKMRKAVTDIGPKPEHGMSPGVENLFALLKEFGPEEDVKKFERQYADGTIKYVELKDVIADHISSHFAEYRKKRAELLRNPGMVMKIFKRGGKRARAVAQETMKRVRIKIGLDQA